MKINKAKLLKAIDAAQAAEAKQREEYEVAKVAYVLQLQRQWRRDELPRLKNLRDLLTTAIKRDWLVTREMVDDALGKSNRYYSSSLPVWGEPSISEFTYGGQRYNKVFLQTAKYNSLRAALEAIEDDTVTPSALQSIGFKELGYLFRAAIS